MPTPVKEKFPELSAMVVRFAEPLNVSVAPLPPEMVPEMTNVWPLAVKLTPEMLSPLIVTAWFGGLNVIPVFDGVTV